MTSTVRRLPAPQTEPPFDDELVQPSTEGSLALALPLLDAPTPEASDADAAALARLLPLPPTGTLTSPRRPRARPETPPGPRAVVFTRALLEVLAGRRPVRQLAGWASQDLLEDLAAHLPAKPAGAGPAPVLTSLHVTQPGDCSAEVCAVVRTRRGRRQAVALRMEHKPGRGWLVTRVALV